MNKIKLLIVLLVIFTVRISFAACTGSSPTWVADADATSVNSCISSAVNGDTINVSSGSFSWSPTINKRISIIGGYGGGTTTINGRLNIFPTLNEDTYQLRVSNFTINGGGGTDETTAVIQWGVRTTDYNLGTGIAMPYNARLDHCIILNGGVGYGVSMHDTLYGVIDNNTFGASDSGYRYVFWNESAYRQNAFNVHPQMDYTPGTNGAVYIEDNIAWVNNDGRLVAHNVGGRTAWRYNTINFLGNNQRIMDIHGTQGTDYSSAWGIEFYGNLASANCGGVADVRSGKNRFFWNVAPGGSIQYYWGSLMTTCPTSNPDAEMINDSYSWNNRVSSSGNLGSPFTYSTNETYGYAQCGSHTPRPAVGIDYFYESSNPGVTSGLPANRPATCTVNQGYWATEQTTGITNLSSYVGDINTYPSRETITGTFYKCTETNTWTAYYTPYTYPHPLRGETPAATVTTISGCQLTGGMIK